MVSQVLISSYTDGPTLTAAAAATCLPADVPTTMPAGYWQINRVVRLRASGRISCVVTTPGTARWALRFNNSGLIDTLAMPLTTVGRTDVPWMLEMFIVCRAAGSTTATVLGQGFWLSDAAINQADAATGPGPGGITVPYNSAPNDSNTFTSTIPSTLDFFFTQTVATGSMTCHTFLLEQLTP